MKNHLWRTVIIAVAFVLVAGLTLAMFIGQWEGTEDFRKRLEGVAVLLLVALVDAVKALGHIGPSANPPGE